jgi:hypothetical protein
MELCRVQHGNFNPASEANGDNKLGWREIVHVVDIINSDPDAPATLKKRVKSGTLEGRTTSTLINYLNSKR